MKKPTKVTAEQWVEIIAKYRAGCHLPTVAKEYNISVSYIYNFVKRLHGRGIKVTRGTPQRDSLIAKVEHLSK